MTEVAFHFNVPDKLGYACRLLRKAYAAGGPVGVVAAQPASHSENRTRKRRKVGMQGGRIRQVMQKRFSKPAAWPRWLQVWGPWWGRK